MKLTDAVVGSGSVVPPVATFDTRVVPPHERIDYWEEHCAEKVVGLRCSCLSEDGLKARYQYFDFGRIKMIDIVGDEHFVERTPYLLRRREKDSAFLTLILSGKVFVNRAGQCAVAEAGDVVLYDTNHAYMHGFPAHARQVIFEIPGEDFRERFADWNLRELVHFGGGTNPGRIVPIALQNILRSAQNSNWRAGKSAGLIEDGIWDVMETACSLVSGRTRSTYHAQTLQRVRKHVVENLWDPELGPASIASATGISLRQLSRLFEGEPLSLMELVLAKRLEGARADLLRLGSGASISDISYRWGFKSLAHFSRKFASRYGVSPSRCR